MEYNALLNSSRLHALVLDVDYTFEEVPDPVCFLRGEGNQVLLDKAFHFTVASGNVIDDFIPNPLGWYIMSPRAISCFNEHPSDCVFLPLKNNKSIQNLPKPLSDFYVAGFKCILNALDLERSEVRWTGTGQSRGILALYEGFLRLNSIPQNCETFLLGEWTVAPIISERISSEILKLGLRGCALQKFEAG
jgi:hypothetical protein